MDALWPISIVMPKLPSWQDLLTLLAVVLLFAGFIKLLQNKTVSIVYYLLFLAALILGTNLFGGIHEGFIFPVKSGGVEYWQDASKIHSVPNFLQNYTLIQPTLLDHSRVHPPGAMLFFYYLRQIWDQPIFVSLVILGIGLVGLYLFFKLISQYVSQKTALFTTVLLGLIPAVQIYFLASFDTVILTCFLACFYFWQHSKSVNKCILSLLFFTISIFLTFGVLFLIPVLVFDDWQRNKNISKSIQLLLISLGVIIGANEILGYNYLTSFQIAHSFEGPSGFYLLVQPLSYLMTRIEDCLEILVFAGPFVTMLLYRALKSLKPWQRPFHLSSTAFTAIVSLLLFFLAGAYYTGETARAALFIYPFLFILLAKYFEKIKISEISQLTLLIAVFAQTVLMQLFGFFSW